MSTALQEAPWISEQRAASEPSGHVQKWLRVWVAIGTLVVLVVIGFLIGITTALSSIDGNLAGVQQAVGGAGTNVAPLPAQVERANVSLSGIDTALKPIPGQADQIVARLDSIATNLTSVDRLLSGTSGTLSTVLGTARTIDNVLESADDPADGSGVHAIHRRVSTANGVLATARNDTKNILSQLKLINGHLDSVCRRAGGSC